MRKVDYSLMFVTDDRITNDDEFFQILEASLKGGASIIQLREKSLDTAPFYQRALQSKSLCEKYGIPLIINDRLDIALAIDADGVHIGQSDMPYPIARKLLGKDKIIGLSVSNNEQAKEASNTDVDYIGLSPIFMTVTKTTALDAPLGFKGLHAIAEIFPRPIVSIGGINLENAASVIENGSAGIAVVSAISRATNPEQATKTLKESIWQAGTNK